MMGTITMDSIINQKGQLTDQINNTKVSVGLDITNSSYLDTVYSFRDITDTIKNDKDIKDKLEVLSKIEIDDEQQEYKKNNLPYFVTSSFKQNRRLNKELESTQLMILDYDHLDDRVIEKRNSLMADPKVLCLFSSPRGGLKVIHRFSEEITDHNKYSALYKYYAKKFGASLGLEPDKTSDAARPCYFSYDRDLYINYEAETLDINTPDAELQISKKRTLKDTADLNLAFKGAKPGNRRTALTRMVGMFVSRKIPKENIYDLLTHWNNSLENPLPEE